MARASPLLLYVLTRAFLAIPMLVILLTAVFVILRLIPGDPIQALFGGRGNPAVVAAARAQLDDDAWATAWAVGRAMSLEQAVAYALEDEAAESGLRPAASVQATRRLETILTLDSELT